MQPHVYPTTYRSLFVHHAVLTHPGQSVLTHPHAPQEGDSRIKQASRLERQARVAGQQRRHNTPENVLQHQAAREERSSNHQRLQYQHVPLRPNDL